MLEMRTIPFLFFGLLLFQFVVCELPPTQIDTMFDLYRLIENSTGSSSNFPWHNSSTQNPCSWKGVSCSSNDSSITKLSLTGFSISISDSLSLVCRIDTLESLDLSNNHLNSIPDPFFPGCGGILGLKLLNFSRNRLVGSLPVFQGFQQLEVLDLSHNLFNGTVVTQLEGLDGLKSLNLSYNMFTGEVPFNLGKSLALEELQLSANMFRGNFPQDLLKYGNLTMIDLGFNMLSGVIPSVIGQLSKLKLLILSANAMSGEIPNSLSGIATLWRFAANRNNFTGRVPPGITRFLSYLDLSYNKLNGSLPINLLSQTNLQAVDLSFNSLEGSIPANISASLVRLRLGSNSFSGLIPASLLGVLHRLTYLEMNENQLTGPIPPELGLCKNLALLDLSGNELRDSIPAELGSLSNLQVLNLQRNRLSGEIPIQLTQLQKLLRLHISWNLLNGSIPSSISRLQSLSNLDLQANNLIGSIPDSIGSMDSLLELQLGKNQLSGLVNSLPTQLQIALNLSNNNLEGPIPESLSRLNGLEVLDLSNNLFSGKIPDFLTQMSSLTQLILSNNQLSGIVPHFGPYVTLSISGNDNLINTTSSSPQLTTKKGKSIAVAVVVAIAVSAVAFVIIVYVALIVSRRIYKVNDEHLHTEEHVTRSQIIKGSLLTGNGIHRSNIDFTKAMEDVSYPSNIILKTRFSTYYKAIMPSGMSYFVKKLNWSDKIFQFGSPGQFEEELAVLGKMNNSNIMTPLAYVLTADCAYLFYEFAEKGTLFDVLHGSLGNALDWTSRYSIALGIAQGLAFLHGLSSSPILLLDLSSKIILLKSLKEPQIGDVELCKVIDPSKSTGSISTLAGSVGYIPPEYAYTMRITTAGNVYSFGVILLELLTGKPAVSEGSELAMWVLSKSAEQDNWDHILDSSVSRTSIAIRGQMLATLRVALACVSVSPEARPKMKSVLRMLLNAR